MKKNEARDVAENILKTGLGWAVSVINMIDPGDSEVPSTYRCMYGNRADREKAEKRRKDDNDWVVIFYEGNTSPDSVRSFATVAAWRLFYVWITKSVVDGWPNPDIVNAIARWYPAREAVVFTGDWEGVPHMPAVVKPSEATVLEWIGMHNHE